MKGKKITAEQIITKLREAEVVQAKGMTLAEVCPQRDRRDSAGATVMIRYVCAAIVAISALDGCGDLGSTASPIDPTDDLKISGTFVVESFAVQCTVKVNPGNDSLWAYFPWTMKYHFEGRPGSVNTVSFVPVGARATHLNMFRVYPDSVGKTYDMSIGFWANSSLAHVDSVVVQFSLGGAYWDRVDGKDRTFGTFDWAIERRVPVHHP